MPERKSRPDPGDSGRAESGLMPAASPSNPSRHDGGAQPEPRFFRALVEQLRELVIVQRSERIAYVNPAAVTALGYDDASDLVGRPTNEVVDADDLRAALEGANMGGVLRLLRRDGAARIAEVTSVGTDFDGGVTLALVARDVTETRHLEAQRVLRERLAAFGTLVIGLEHELNNPMTYTMSGVEAALRRLRVRAASGHPTSDDAVVVDALERALTGVQRMRGVVRSLVMFVQGDQEARSIVDVRAMLESAIQLAWHTIRHRAQLVKELAEVPPVEANAARLGQVFLNLLVNAAEAIPEGRADRHTVRVVTRPSGDDKVAIEISDTGMGIPSDAAPRIFDPFFTTKASGAATGLGLSIAHGIVTDLGGQVWVESKVGHGTTAHVELPCARAWRKAAKGFDARSAKGGGRVLIIDDDEFVGDSIGLTLGDENDVTVVTSGREALELLAAGQRYDVILCDLLMPVMTGMDFFAELTRVAPDAVRSVVFMTGGASTARARAFVSGIANPCIQKPIDAHELREVVRSRVRGPSR